MSFGKIVDTSFKVPCSNMVDFVKQAQTHEIGSINSIDPVSYRGKIVEGTVPVPETAYMKFFLIKKNNRQYGDKRKSNRQHSELGECQHQQKKADVVWSEDR